MGYLIIIIIIAIVLAVAIMSRYLARHLRRVYRSRDFQLADREAWQLKWQALEKMLDDNPAHWPSAIIEADKLFDAVLKSMRLPGKDTGERFQFLMRDRQPMQYARRARFIRNRLVHESNFILNKKTAKDTLAIYRRALKDLGILI